MGPLPHLFLKKGGEADPQGFFTKIYLAET